MFTCVPELKYGDFDLLQTMVDEAAELINRRLMFVVHLYSQDTWRHPKRTLYMFPDSWSITFCYYPHAVNEELSPSRALLCNETLFTFGSWGLYRTFNGYYAVWWCAYNMLVFSFFIRLHKQKYFSFEKYTLFGFCLSCECMNCMSRLPGCSDPN